MPIGFIASLILHGVLLGWALLAVVTTPPLNIPRPEPVEVAMVSESDLVRLKQGDRDAKVLEAEGKDGPAKEPPKKETPKPAPPPPPQAAAPPPPPPEPPKPDPIAAAIQQAAVEPPPPPPKVEPPKAEPPKPDPIGDLAAAAAQEPPKPEPPKPPPPKPEPPKPPPPKPVPKAAPKPAATPPPPPKKQDLASLVNDALKTTPDKSATNAPPKALIDRRAVAAQAAGQKTAANAKGPAAGAPEGTDTVLSADKASMLASLMKNNVRRCWNINAGLEGAAKLVVKLEVKLNPAGQLVGEPRVTNSGNGAQFEDAVNSARRAVIDCQPYTNLPPELYAGGWEFMLLILDPAKMF